MFRPIKRARDRFGFDIFFLILILRNTRGQLLYLLRSLNFAVFYNLSHYKGGKQTWFAYPNATVASIAKKMPVDMSPNYSFSQRLLGLSEEF